MKNNITELVFILGRSGSMSGLEADTIGGFNSMIKKQRQEDGECLVSTVLFDDESEVLHDRVQLAHIADKKGAQVLYENLSKAVCSVRASRPLSAKWCSDIRADFEKRGKNKRR